MNVGFADRGTTKHVPQLIQALETHTHFTTFFGLIWATLQDLPGDGPRRLLSAGRPI